MDERVGERGIFVKPNVCEFDDNDLLVAVFIRKKPNRCPDECAVQNTKHAKKHKNSKYSQKKNWAINSPRTVLSWLLYSGVVFPDDVIQFRNPKDDSLLKEGLVTNDCVACLCCHRSLSISEFESHCGLKPAEPSMSLTMESGKSLALCQLEAWSAEYQAKKAPPEAGLVDEGDDVCGLCGLEGNLVLCDSCPAAFHPACLFEQIPEGNWYCSQCRCQFCGVVVKDKISSISLGTLECTMCEHRYHDACVKGEVVNAGLTSDNWFCGQSCFKLYDALQSYVGLTSHLSDEVSWSLLRCIDGDYKVHSSRRSLALKAEYNSKLAVAITILENYFLQMVDKKTNVDMIPQVIYNWRSKFPRLNFQGFYTVVLEKKGVMVSVASIRCHGAQVAELPFIATCSKFRKQGMCRLLVSTIEKMLKSLGVKKLAVPAASPALVDMWISKYGFQHLDEGNRIRFRKIHLMVLPGSTWLVKSL